MDFGNDSGKLTFEKSTSETPYRYEVKLYSNRAEEEEEASVFGALLKFQSSISCKELSLKTGVYVLGGKRLREKSGDENQAAEGHVFVLNPTERPMLPVLGVALALGNPFAFADKILLFKPRRWRKSHYLIDLTSVLETQWIFPGRRRRSKPRITKRKRTKNNNSKHLSIYRAGNCSRGKTMLLQWRSCDPSNIKEKSPDSKSLRLEKGKCLNCD